MVQERIRIQREEAPLQVTSAIKTHFQGIAKWALILSSIGFVLVSLVLLAATLSTIDMGLLRGNTGSSPIYIGMGYLIVGALLLVPVMALFQFSHHLKRALKEEDQAAMNKAFTNLKSGLRYSGLAVIGGLLFVLLGLFFT